MSAKESKSVGLQDWINTHPVGAEMLWKGAAGGQLSFVRDVLARLFSVDDYDLYQKCAEVVSSHMSKSIDLPVYKLSRPGLTIWLRDNFYNWKMSVKSDAPIEADFGGLFHTTPPIDPKYTGDPLNSVYFEGFSGDYIFGYYSKNNKQFSAEIGGDHSLYVSVFLILKSLGLIKPYKWSTSKDKK